MEKSKGTSSNFRSHCTRQVAAGHDDPRHLEDNQDSDGVLDVKLKTLVGELQSKMTRMATAVDQFNYVPEPPESSQAE